MKKKRKTQVEGIVETPTIASDVVVNMPQLLKKILVWDWKRINALGYLVSLPRKPSVSVFLKQYIDDVLANGERKNRTFDEDNVLRETVFGIQKYFDVALGTSLLYKIERYQYYDMLESYPNCTPSQLYGMEHFLRLLVKLPEYVGKTAIKTMKPEEIFLLNSHLESIMRYICKRCGEIFDAKNYENQSPEYQRILAD